MRAYGPLAAWYDALTRDVPYEAFADYYERLFAEKGRRSIRTIVDLACGTGTLTLLLARRGYETIAVDGSAEMLAQLAEKTASLDDTVVPPLLLCQELAELDLYGTVDCAVCSLDGMNYIPEDELPEIFRRLRLFLEPDGLLIFDVNSPERLRSLDGELFCDETEELLCLWRADFDQEENCLCYEMDIFSETEEGLWQRESEEHIEYAHHPERLLQLLRQVGFVMAEVLTDGPQNEEGRLFIIAQNTPH